MEQYVLSFILNHCEKDNIKEFISWVILKEDLESYIAAGWHRGKKPKKN